MPRSARPRANSTIPVLSDTDSSARCTRTSLGEIGANRCSAPCVMRPDSIARCGLGAAPEGRPDRSARDQSDRFGQQLVLDRMQALEHVVGVARIRQLHGPLQDHRAGVHAVVDEVHRDPEHLDPVLQRLLDRVQPRKRRQQRRVDVDHTPGKAPEERRPSIAACTPPARPARRRAPPASRPSPGRARPDRRTPRQGTPWPRPRRRAPVPGPSRAGLSEATATTSIPSRPWTVSSSAWRLVPTPEARTATLMRREAPATRRRHSTRSPPTGTAGSPK